VGREHLDDLSIVGRIILKCRRCGRRVGMDRDQCRAFVNTAMNLWGMMKET
jgi:hypothetical protein